MTDIADSKRAKCERKEKARNFESAEEDQPGEGILKRKCRVLDYSVQQGWRTTLLLRLLSIVYELVYTQ